MADEKKPNNSAQQQPGWAFKPDKDTVEPPAGGAVAEPQQTADRPPKDAEQVSWTASEFIANHKTAGWYLLLFAAIFAVAGLTFVLTTDWISTATIVVVGSLFAILAGKKPRQLNYQLDSRGVTIGQKFYPYAMFKSFTVLREYAIGYINLLPLKRFMPELSVYYPPEEENKILGVLAASLPNDQKAEHGFDRLMKKIRF